MAPTTADAGKDLLSRHWHYHFLGLGGVGMSALAEVLHRGGLRISGSDMRQSPVLDHLKELGIPVFLGHEPQHLADADAVVYSSAIPKGHPIWETVHRRGLLRLHRAELLGELTRHRRTIAVTGTHGKTTTTAALSLALLEAGWDPTVLVGGQVPQLEGQNNRAGGGEWLVLEADESDGSFLNLSPQALLITNVEDDHLDHHGTREKLLASFAEFIGRLPADGLLVYCRDDAQATALAEGYAGRKVSYGQDAAADVRVVDVTARPTGMHFTLDAGGDQVAVQSSLHGAHNALNLAGVYALATGLSLPATPLQHTLAQFRGVDRRQQVVGLLGDMPVIDDYAHHPTEIRATLAAIQAAYPGAAVTVVFQPHLYSRTARLAGEFAAALRPAARVFVTDVYAAREEPLPDVSGQLITDALGGHTHAHYVADWHELTPVLRALPEEGVLVIMGAGDITGLGPALLADAMAHAGAGGERGP